MPGLFEMMSQVCDKLRLSRGLNMLDKVGNIEVVDPAQGNKKFCYSTRRHSNIHARAKVQGSGKNAYTGLLEKQSYTVAIEIVENPPKTWNRSFRCSCTCLDKMHCCKHVVAVCKKVSDDPDLLRELGLSNKRKREEEEEEAFSSEEEDAECNQDERVGNVRKNGRATFMYEWMCYRCGREWSDEYGAPTCVAVRRKKSRKA